MKTHIQYEVHSLRVKEMQFHCFFFVFFFCITLKGVAIYHLSTLYTVTEVQLQYVQHMISTLYTFGVKHVEFLVSVVPTALSKVNSRLS